MFVVKIIQCSKPSYWYNNKIGKFYQVNNQRFCINNKWVYLSEIYNTNIITDIITNDDYIPYRLTVNKYLTVDFKDVEIYPIRYVKIMKLLNKEIEINQL